MRMSAGQPASRSPSATLAQQPGQLGHLRVVAGQPGRVQRRLPPGGGHLPDRAPGPLTEIEPDRVGHRTPLRTSVIPAMPWWSISFSDRHIVGTDATCPNSRS
jgi:hypothetical protein